MKDASKSAIGVFGGTFNPVHMGHLILAQDALERLELSQVLFIPSHISPHKSPSAVLPARHRTAMLDLAVQDDIRFSVCDVELQRGGVSYSVDTLREIRSLYPGAAIHFIIGSDSLLELHLWKDVYELLSLCTVVAMVRPGSDRSALRPERLNLDPPWPERLLANVMAAHAVEISSSDIRRRVAEGLSIRYLVPPSVEMYIQEHRLYRS